MKTLAELQAIRDRMKDSVVMRSGSGNIRAVVGMATCGIAAGARPVLSALVEEVNNLHLNEKVTYVNMTAEKVRRVAKEHLRDGKVVEEYTIGAVEK